MTYAWHKIGQVQHVRTQPAPIWEVIGAGFVPMAAAQIVPHDPNAAMSAIKTNEAILALLKRATDSLCGPDNG